jgi:hypothetical protein
MAKKRNVKNTLWFASHPYQTPPKSDLVGNICLWNRSAPHHRKLLSSTEATVIDAGNNVLQYQDITFIGEWECCSSFVPCGQKSPFNLIHTPIHSKHDDAILDCMNTDPYVFGDEFKWICCKQPNKSRIRRGDIVLFGSYTLLNRKVDKMLIDTVFVVDRVIGIEEFDPAQFTWCYNDVTITHTKDKKGTKIAESTENKDFYIVLGKMYDPAKSYEENVPFSYVPCRRTSNGLMDKLILDRHLPIKELAGGPLRIGQNGGHLDIDDHLDAWDVVTRLVRSNGCDLGVYMPEPMQPLSNQTIDNEANLLTSKQNENEKNSTLCGGGCAGPRC